MVSFKRYTRNNKKATYSKTEIKEIYVYSLLIMTWCNISRDRCCPGLLSIIIMESTIVCLIRDMAAGIGQKDGQANIKFFTMGDGLTNLLGLDPACLLCSVLMSAGQTAIIR